MKILTRQDVDEILKELIVENDNNRLGLDYSDIKPGCSLIDLGFDSLDVVELSIKAEMKLGIQIDDAEVEKIMKRKCFFELGSFLHTRYCNSLKTTANE